MHTTNQLDLSAISEPAFYRPQISLIRLHRIKSRVKIWSGITLIASCLLLWMIFLSVPLTGKRGFWGGNCMGGHCKEISTSACIVGMVTGMVGVWASRKRKVTHARCFVGCVVLLIVLCGLTLGCVSGRHVRERSERGLRGRDPRSHFDRPASPHVDRLKWRRPCKTYHFRECPPPPSACFLPDFDNIGWYILFTLSSLSLFLISIHYHKSLTAIPASISIVEMEQVALVI